MTPSRPIVWPTLDDRGLPSYVRVVDRAMPPSYVTKIPTRRTAFRRVDAVGVAPFGPVPLRRGYVYGSILILAGVVWFMGRR